MADEVKSDAIRAALHLLRTSRVATLATVCDGQPFASLITPATAADRSILMLLSGLSPHTSHLRAEARCSIMVMGAQTGPNPQTAPRLSLTGSAAPEPDPLLKQRWVSLHPYAAFYADLGDFRLWRFRPSAGQFVGGFASAHRLQDADLAPDPEAVAAVDAAEASILDHCNRAHASALEAIAAAHGRNAARWQMATCDVDGCDLVCNDDVVRVPWSAPVDGPHAIRAELVRLAAAAPNSGTDARPSK